MIFKGRLNSSPSIDFRITGVSMNYLSIREVVLMLDEDQHDTVQVRMVGVPPRLATEMIGQPVYLSWVVGSNQHLFCGYVYSTNPIGKARAGLVNSSQIQEMHVVCLGASSIMRGKKVRTWTGMSVRELAKTFANDYMFSYSVPKDTFMMPNVLQDEKSDWQILVNMADTLGYSVNVHGTHLSIWDRTKYLARNSFYVEAKSQNTAGGRVYDAPGQILELEGLFEPNIVTVTAGIGSNNTSTGTVGPYARGTGSGRDVTPMYEYRKQVNTLNARMAEKIARAANKHTFPFSIRVTLTGVCGVIPGSILNIKDYNSYFDGLWCVTGVTQRAGADRFTTEIKAVRDTTDEDPVKLLPGYKLGVAPEPILRNGSWVSSKQYGETYA